MTFTKHHIAIVIAASIMTAEASAFGDETQAPQDTTKVSKEGKTDLSLFDTVNEKGTNLRHVLASTNIVSSIIPFGPNITSVQISSGAGLFRGGVFDTVTKDYFNAIHRLCPTSWEIKDTELDLMTGRATWIWKDVSKQQLVDDPYIVNSHNTSTGETVRGARCKGVFDWDGAKTIRHTQAQPHIWKREGQPLPDTLPSDGIVPTQYFGEEYKPGMFGIGKYPSPVDTTAWAVRLCEAQGGRAKMAIEELEAVNGKTRNRYVVLGTDEEIYKKREGFGQTDCYHACEYDKGSFLVRIVRGTQDRKAQNIVFQKGRTLESIGIR